MTFNAHFAKANKANQLKIGNSEDMMLQGINASVGSPLIFYRARKRLLQYQKVNLFHESGV